MTAEQVPQLSMLYKVATGTSQERGYGIALARAIGFPEEVLRDAEEISRSMVERHQSKQKSSEFRKVQRRRKLMLNLDETLRTLENSDMDQDAFQSCRARLRAEFILKMTEIEEEASRESDSETGPRPALTAAFVETGK
ncbi:unnamed protein product [Parascedosporium putredinis]|uniref:DNA mismatch repair proteins mutS family domain-containing protein n=1 Tax=Parascedosporium putredinis TaxID=1442378 RepID=A0A9P1H6S1_9PEZI|nr:unnamed protein product [Parascedosporium putredinis]CAI7998956.1 unnamed protein product [Parascedosporium putredinis]